MGQATTFSSTRTESSRTQTVAVTRRVSTTPCFSSATSPTKSHNSPTGYWKTGPRACILSEAWGRILVRVAHRARVVDQRASSMPHAICYITIERLNHSPTVFFFILMQLGSVMGSRRLHVVTERPEHVWHSNPSNLSCRYLHVAILINTFAQSRTIV